MALSASRVESDAVLAGRAARGDGVAFAELARRYDDLIGFYTHRHAWGHEREDERQEALIGLFEACRAFDPARGKFGAIATVRVRSRVWNARERVRAGKHRILTEALRLEYIEPGEAGDEEPLLAETLAAGDAADPAVVVELRDELRRLALDPAQRRRREPRLRRRFTDEQVATALSLVAQGKSLREAGAAVGAWPSSVGNWLRKAA